MEAASCGTLVWRGCAVGERLVDLDAEKGLGLCHAVSNLGSADRHAVGARVDAVCSRLGFAFESS